MHIAVITRHDDAELAKFGRQLQPIAQGFDERDAALLMSFVAGPFLMRRRRLAEIVHQRRKAHLHIGAQVHGLVEHHQGVHARVDFRVPLFRLRHAEQRVDFRIHDLQRAAVAQHLKKYTGAGLAQRLFGFLPDAFGHQGIDFAALDHGAHQRHGFRSDAKPKRRKAGGESREAQDAHRILHERGRHVPQHARFQVAAAAVRVDPGSVAGLRNGIDGQIAAGEILFAA